MTISVTEISAIRDRLFDLSDNQFSELVAYVERAHALADARAFSTEALSAMRPRLRVSRPPRRLTAHRVFCRPFEDLLFDASAAGKRPGQIARRAIMPCWAAVAPRIDAGLLADLERELAGLTVAEPEWPSRFGARLWPAAAAAARVALAELRSGSADRAAPGGDAPVDELADMARMLAIAEVVEELRGILVPKPLPRLDETLAAVVAMQFQALADTRETSWESLAYFVIARMADPVELARAYGGGCSDPGLHILGVTASKVMIGKVGAVVAELAAVTENSPDIAASVAARGEVVADEIAKLREGMRDRRFSGSIAEIERVQQGLRSAVARNVLEGSDALIAGAFDGAPGTDAAAREALRENAESRAHALWKCARFAGKIGMDREVRDTIKNVEEATTRAALDQLRALEAGGAQPDVIDATHEGLVNAVRVLELVAGSDKADALRLRGVAALDKLRAS